MRSFFKKISRALRRRPLLALIALLLIVLGALAFFTSRDSAEPKKVSFSEMINLVNSDDSIETLRIDSDRLTVLAGSGEHPKTFSSGYPIGASDAGLDRLLKAAEKNKLQVYSNPLPNRNPGLGARFLNLLPALLIIGLIIFIFLRSGMIPGGKFARPASAPAINFDDVAGCDEAVSEIREIEAYLRDPKGFTRLGAKPPKGLLLHGPPGTGKTLLAKALAGSADVPFFSLSGSNFVEMFAGLGASRVRELFTAAAKVAPAIIFIDELDSLGTRRGSGSDGGSRENDQTLVEFLKQIDGFDASEHPIFVVGATNRIESLDPALVRPGRFDRHVSVDAPDRRGRNDILEIHTRGLPLEAEIKLDRVAVQTAGMTGADLALIVNEATIVATRRQGDEISNRDFDDAYLRVVAGAEKKNRAMSASERERVAIHEAGHAIVQESLPGNDLVHKISIIPRGQSGGQTVSVSREDVYLHSPEDLLNMVAGLLAGRAAEEALLASISSGAADDLRRANLILEKMFCQLGMSKALGMRVSDEQRSNLGDETNRVLDEELRAGLDFQYQRASDLIQARIETVRAVADELLEQETIDRERFLEIYRARSVAEPGRDGDDSSAAGEASSD